LRDAPLVIEEHPRRLSYHRIAGGEHGLSLTLGIHVLAARCEHEKHDSVGLSAAALALLDASLQELQGAFAITPGKGAEGQADEA
jgi:hypothetical protein